MTLITALPTPEGQAMLKALQAAVAKSLEQKRKLGHYAVVWQDGRPVLTGPDAPKIPG